AIFRASTPRLAPRVPAPISDLTDMILISFIKIPRSKTKGQWLQLRTEKAARPPGARGQESARERFNAICTNAFWEYCKDGKFITILHSLWRGVCTMVQQLNQPGRCYLIDLNEFLASHEELSGAD